MELNNIPQIGDLIVVNYNIGHNIIIGYIKKGLIDNDFFIDWIKKPWNYLDYASTQEITRKLNSTYYNWTLIKRKCLTLK